VGVESFAEYLDIEIAPGFGADRLRENLNRVLPEGFSVMAAASIPAKSPSLSTIIERVRYRVTLPEKAADLQQQVETFMARSDFPFSRIKKHGLQEYDLRHELHSLSAVEHCLTMEIGRGKPLEFVTAITGLEADSLKECRIEKLAVIFKDSSFSI
jgi:radical SAM-linked protein